MINKLWLKNNQRQTEDEPLLKWSWGFIKLYHLHKSLHLSDTIKKKNSYIIIILIISIIIVVVVVAVINNNSVIYKECKL